MRPWTRKLKWSKCRNWISYVFVFTFHKLHRTCAFPALGTCFCVFLFFFEGLRCPIFDTGDMFSRVICLRLVTRFPVFVTRYKLSCRVLIGLLRYTAYERHMKNASWLAFECFASLLLEDKKFHPTFSCFDEVTVHGLSMPFKVQHVPVINNFKLYTWRGTLLVKKYILHVSCKTQAINVQQPEAFVNLILVLERKKHRMERALQN